MNNALLITLVFFAIILLSGWYIWNVIFFKSWRRLFFMFLGVFLESTKRVDAYEPIEPSTRVPKSDVMKAQAEALDFEDVLEKSRPPLPPQQASIPATETGEFARETSYNGWPRELDEATRRDTRPFRAVHLNTENDDIQTELINNDIEENASLKDDKH